MNIAPKYRHSPPPDLLTLAAVAALPAEVRRVASFELAALLGLAGALKVATRSGIAASSEAAAKVKLSISFGLIATFGLAGAMGLATPASAQAPAAPVVTEDLQDIPALEAIVKTAAAQELAPLTEHERFLVGPLQPHLQLQRCATPVKPVIGNGHHMKDRVTVELRCAGPAAWHLYVPVRVIGTSTAAVTVHAIVVGSVLKAEDLRVEQHDISELPQGYFDDPAVAVGLTASRPIAGGTILTNQQLVASKAVQRGQTVTLVADAGGMLVRMAGRAMSDGLVNQRVKVQNLSSGKVVEGIARSEQVVEIIFQ
jgi:flagella basal body P-ring formation protein FlgA